MTLKHDPKHGRTIYYMQIQIWKNAKAYLIEINLLIKDMKTDIIPYALIQTQLNTL